MFHSKKFKKDIIRYPVLIVNALYRFVISTKDESHDKTAKCLYTIYVIVSIERLLEASDLVGPVGDEPRSGTLAFFV